MCMQRYRLHNFRTKRYVDFSTLWNRTRPVYLQTSNLAAVFPSCHTSSCLIGNNLSPDNTNYGKNPIRFVELSIHLASVSFQYRAD